MRHHPQDVAVVLPELKGRLDGTSIRVPTPNVSVVDLKFIPGRETTVDEINKAMERIATKQQGAADAMKQAQGEAIQDLQKAGIKIDT